MRPTTSNSHFPHLRFPGVPRYFFFCDPPLVWPSDPFQLSIRYSLFAVGQTLNSSGISFDTKPSDLEFEMALSGWPFAQSSNTLRLYLLLNVVPNITSLLQNNGTNNITTFTLLSSNETMPTTIRMIGYGTVDGVNTPMSFSLTQNQTDSDLLALVLEIPHFSSSFQYDPDFSVILPSPQQEDSSSATDLLPLLSLIVNVHSGDSCDRHRAHSVPRVGTQMAPPVGHPKRHDRQCHPFPGWQRWRQCFVISINFKWLLECAQPILEANATVVTEDDLKDQSTLAEFYLSMPLSQWSLAPALL